MSTKPSTMSAAGFLTRHYSGILAAFAILFVLQTGLVPFDFSTEIGETGSRELFGAATSRFTLPDIVSNLFLYVPVGILFHWVLSRGGRNKVAATLLAVVAAALLSGGIEFVQAYSPVRVSSIIDFVCNIIGAGIGATISLTARWIVPKVVGVALLELHVRPQASLIKGYCFILAFAAAMPFSLSFDVGFLQKSLRSVTLIPFGSVATYHQTAQDALARGDEWHYDLARWQASKRWSRWTVESFSFVVFVWLLLPVVRGYYRFTRRGAMLLTLWLGGTFAVGLSVIQIPILTRDMDVTDILFRWLGVAAGLLSWFLYVHQRDYLTEEELAARRLSIVKTGCAATVIYIAYIGSIPFSFDPSHGGLARAMVSPEFLPFFGYFVTRFDLMMADVMEKFAVYGLFAALLASCWKQVEGRDTRYRVLAVAGVGTALSLPFELLQVYIPVRITSLTDPILAGCGCVAGVLAREHAVRFYRFAASRRMQSMLNVEIEAAQTPALSPTDALVGTLTEPRADAPREPSPGRRPVRRPRR